MSSGSCLSEDELAYLQSLERDNPVQPFIESYFARESDPSVELQHTGWNKERYLDFAEARFIQFIPYQHESGVIIDPFDHKERQFVTSSFAMTGAVLLSAGRCSGFEEPVVKAMDAAVAALSNNRVPDRHADFTTHMLIKALRILEKNTRMSVNSAVWRQGLASFQPEHVYSQVEPHMPLRQVRNWATYAMLGEQMRITDGLAFTKAFIDRYLEAQMPRFTPEGLYRDPNLPAAYDMAARDNLAGLLAEGYSGPYSRLLDTLLRRGALTMLFTQSVNGETSCGGRSNQFLWNELTFAHICEREALLYHKSGYAQLAGVFKRAARRAMEALERWMPTADDNSIRPVKNRFAEPSRAGYELYAYYANYLLYAAKIAASCYLLADDSIEEQPAPCDTGDYVLSLPSFNRIYAAGSPSQGSYHLCMDTAAQAGQDATGWVRLHRRDLPGETALSVGIPGSFGEIPLVFMRPRHELPAPLHAAAIGLQWRDGHGAWHRLADYGRRKHEVYHALDRNGQPLEPEAKAWQADLKRVCSGLQALQFEIVYEAVSNSMVIPGLNPAVNGVAAEEVQRRAWEDIISRPANEGCSIIREHYCISRQGVTVEWEVEAAEGAFLTAIAVNVPLLETNGKEKALMSESSDGSVSIQYGSVVYTIKQLLGTGAAEASLELHPGLMPNRNGHYGLAQWTLVGHTKLKLHFTLEHL
ncbi:hypothetical protein [Paenibacillus periandrae]|uniref:hypothetical protein n=1 Tax=Paenibacillus periandrae TaxID=1761741 RepID=UPI001F09D0C1|nr:hypothetical protein [Paenibacillus periandrae]